MGTFNDGFLRACGEECNKKRGRRSEGDTMWLNGEGGNIKKDTHKASVGIVLRRIRGGTKA